MAGATVPGIRETMTRRPGIWRGQLRERIVSVFNDYSARNVGCREETGKKVPRPSPSRKRRRVTPLKPDTFARSTKAIRSRKEIMQKDASGPGKPPTRVGLCADCAFSRVIESPRGSTFYLCERSRTDPAFPKYPPLPVLRCCGYVRTHGR